MDEVPADAGLRLPNFSKHVADDTNKAYYEGDLDVGFLCSTPIKRRGAQ